MGMICKGTCVRYRAPALVHTSRYDNGQKRCQVCSIFLIWIGEKEPDHENIERDPFYRLQGFEPPRT